MPARRNLTSLPTDDRDIGKIQRRVSQSALIEPLGCEVAKRVYPDTESDMFFREIYDHRGYIAELEKKLRFASKHSKYCQWKYDVDGFWFTECDNTYEFMDSCGPGDNGFIYCPYCGGRLCKEYGPNGRTP